MTFALALVAPSWACEHVEIGQDGVEVDVVVEGCGVHTHDVVVATVVEEPPPAPPVAEVDDVRQRSVLKVGYGMQFLQEMPGHDLKASFTGEKDAYLSGELRYMPASDLLWVGRIGAGFDVFGQSDWDLTVGLFLGSAGEWDRERDRAVLYSAPIGGTEIGVGYDGERLFGGYRWLAGLGGGPVDSLVTENELTFGYKVLPELHVFGQYLVVSPGEYDNQSGFGLGARVAF
ncbi:MAG: hypothetical protein ABMB14_17595 [Myxococcota bacterium]